MSKGITAPYKDPVTPFYTGTVALASAVSGKLVSISDHSYLLDLASNRFRYVSVPAMRPQADTSEQVGEQSLTVDGLWRRILSSWDRGAGQDWLDRDDGDKRRFRTSRGIDPWERWELSMLPDVSEVAEEATGWNSLTVGEFTGGQRLVAGGGNGRCITVNPALGTTTVGGALAGVCRVASNGSAVYVADNTDIWLIDAAGTGKSSFNANVNAASVLAFAKNRLIACTGAQLWDVISGATAAAHYTNPWAGWQWTAVAEGQSVIYACGFAGDRGLVFSIGLKADGTGLDAPIVAAELPHGEVPLSMVGYVGFLVIGTSKGVRVAQQGTEGLTLGAVVGEKPCRCLEPQDRFVWFGWDDAFSNAGGLGRIDLKTFVEPLAPAYATDLMAQEVGLTTAVTTFDNRRFFTTGTGLYVQTAAVVATGFIESGTITFNISDDKVAVFADVRHEALLANESVRVDARVMDGTYSVIGVSNQIGSIRPPDPYAMNHSRAVGHELMITLTKGTDPTGPVLTGIILAGQPSPSRSFHIFVPLLIASTAHLEDTDQEMDVPAEVAYLRRLAETQQLVRFTSGVVSHLVFVEDYEWLPHHSTQDERSFEGTMVVKLKSAELAI